MSDLVAPSTTIRGWLDHLEYVFGVGWVLQGWAADERRLDHKLSVRIVRDEDDVGHAIADRSRDDVAAAGVGDGRHGFETIVPESIIGNATSLALSLVVEEDERDIVVATRTLDLQRMVGYLEGLRGIIVSGWAFDPTRPEAALSLDMIIDGNLIARVDADRYREDLAGGYHGFEWLLPEAFLDGSAHTLSVRLTNDADRGLGDPLSFTIGYEHLSEIVQRRLKMKGAALGRLREVEQKLLAGDGRLPADAGRRVR